MLRSHQSELRFMRVVRQVLPLGAIAGAALMAGCSADISRLEKPTYGLGERPPMPSEPMGRRNAGAPPAYENAGWPNSGPRPGSSASAPVDRVERVASLPETSAPVNPSQPFDAPKKAKSTAAAAPAANHGAPILAGATIDVQPGDTLFGLSKKHHVSIAALMEVNGLKTAMLKPGQKIILPANARRPITKTAAKPVSASPAPAVGQAPIVAATPAATVTHAAAAPAPAGDWDGSYVVKPGDSLYGIARAHKVHLAELQRQNGITDVMRLKPGATLKVPSGVAMAAAPASAVAETAPVAAAPSVAPAPAVSGGGVRLLNPPVEALPSKESAANAPVKVAGPASAAVASAAGVKFRWPVRGTVLAGFGKRPDGLHNDGINIAVPKGTDITAADAGTVAYAGSEIKAYGNLILIRHEGGWVTAYAHADEILVKRGDAITRGQVIAKAGSSGAVDQPQVHFELRQGSKPIDPAPHMEK